LKSEDAAGAGFFEESEWYGILTRGAAQLFRENRRNFREAADDSSLALPHRTKWVGKVRSDATSALRAIATGGAAGIAGVCFPIRPA
jgi:hypothetical protein